jgi:hypothetical protein
MSGALRLEFVEYRSEAYLEILQRLYGEGKRKFRLRPWNRLAAEVAGRASTAGLPVSFVAGPGDQAASLPANVSVSDSAGADDAAFLFLSDARPLASSLMDYLDLESGALVAPVTDYYFKNKPLFVISIPKSGTHLLLELVRAFGYESGVVCPEEPSPGLWYCVEYSNTHTSARDFFIDTVRRSPFGNRLHPFLTSPAVFIYRNPLDVVVSEANYYHKDGKTTFSGYLSHLSFEERLLRLIDDPWLLGTIMDRMGHFVAWLDFPNVIPMSFEELVGASGGGDREIQKKLIWSLQLKLQIPGDPEEFGRQIYNERSPTFGEGQIGNYPQYFTPQAMEKFAALPQAVMRSFGYFLDKPSPESFLPQRIEEFRRRPLRYSEASFEEHPIAVEYNYFGCNIVRHRGLYRVVPQCLGNLDLTDPKRLGWTRYFIATYRTLDDAKRAIQVGGAFYRALFWKRLAAGFWSAARRALASESVG